MAAGRSNGSRGNRTRSKSARAARGTSYWHYCIFLASQADGQVDNVTTTDAERGLPERASHRVRSSSEAVHSSASRPSSLSGTALPIRELPTDLPRPYTQSPPVRDHGWSSPALPEQRLGLLPEGAGRDDEGEQTSLLLRLPADVPSSSSPAITAVLLRPSQHYSGTSISANSTSYPRE